MGIAALVGSLPVAPSVTDPMLLTSMPPPSPAQLLEGAPLQGHCPGGEGPAGCIWHQCPQHDFSRLAMDVPPLTAPGNPAIPGGSASVFPFLEVGEGGGMEEGRGLHNYLVT